MAASMGKFACRIFARLRAISPRGKYLLASKSVQPIRVYSSAQLAGRQKGEHLQKIVIPNRIDRSPTAVLEVLAAEAGRDTLAADFTFMDDPYLIPTNNMQRRNYSLAKASGEKAAKWAIENFPESFANEYIAEPRIDAFMPTPSIGRIKTEYGDTLVGLTKLMENRFIEAAWELYSRLVAEGATIQKETQQDLLELLCFYNGKDKSETPTQDEINYQRDLKLMYSDNKKTQKKTWKEGGAAMQLFEQMDQDSGAYNAIIQGMCRHGATEEAREMYNKMIDGKLEVSEETYNSLISSLPSIDEETEVKWDLALRYLKDMQNMNIAPTLKTFNTLLTVVLSLGRWKKAKKMAIEALGEMKACGIEPSLGTWALALRIFYYTDSQAPPIIYSVLDEIADHGPYEFEDITDFDFFSIAMNKACTNMKDVELAKRIDSLLNMNNNARFLGDAVKEGQYYNNYLRLLCSLEVLEETMEVYERCTPHLFTPHMGCVTELLEAIELYDGHRYLPQIWSDLVLFEYLRREDVVELLLRLMASRKHDNNVQENCNHAMIQIRRIIEDAQELGRDTLPIALSGPILGHLIRICLNSSNFELAVYFYDTYTSKMHVLQGAPSSEALSDLAVAFIDAHEVDRFMSSVYRMSELSHEVGELIEKARGGLELTDSQQQRLQMML